MTTPPSDRTRATWGKSTRSNGNSGYCVKWAEVDGMIGVRDSKHPDGPILVFTPSEWTAFTQGVKDGEADLA